MFVLTMVFDEQFLAGSRCKISVYCLLSVSFYLGQDHFQLHYKVGSKAKNQVELVKHVNISQLGNNFLPFTVRRSTGKCIRHERYA
jgi:hypothetical protein